MWLKDPTGRLEPSGQPDVEDLLHQLDPDEEQILLASKQMTSKLEKYLHLITIYTLQTCRKAH